jgi:hypothetical protein
MACSIGAHELNTAAEIRFEISTGRIDHVLGEIESHDTSARESLQKIASKPASTAAGVEDSFIPTKGNTREHLLSPADLGRGNLVVDGGIPFAGIFGHGDRVIQVSAFGFQLSAFGS